MDTRLRKLDWSSIEVFLAVAEAGSLSGAARKLGTSQPTVGRQVREIEERLGEAVFQRRPRGMGLTDLGAAMLEPAQVMRDAAGRIALIAAGADDAPSGTVRISASVFTAHHVLPSILARIRAAEPAIALELVASDRSENLLFREADIAVRMYRPTQDEVVTRHIGDAALGLYGAKAYLERCGRPEVLSDLWTHDFVGFDTNPEMIQEFRAAGWDVDRDFFTTRCDAQAVVWELVRAGCGLGFCARYVASSDPLVEELRLGLPLPVLPVWLTAHEALRRTPRIRRVWDMLAAGLRPFLDAPSASG